MARCLVRGPQTAHCRGPALFTLPQASLLPHNERHCSLAKALSSESRKRELGRLRIFLGPSNLTPALALAGFNQDLILTINTVRCQARTLDMVGF